MDIYTKLFSYIQEKINSPGVQNHTKNLGWMFFARIGSMCITFIATAFIARHLGPTNYGELSYAVSFVGLFSFIASLGIDQILHRDLIKHPERKNELLGSALVARLLASLAAILVTVASAFFISSKDVSLFLIFTIALSPLFGSFQLLGYEFQAEAKSKYPSILSLGIILILNILKILVIFFDKGVIYLSFIVLLEPILYSLGYMYLKQKFYKDIYELRYKKDVALSIVKDSFPLIFASAFYLIYTRIDQVMIKNMLGAKSVGLYDASVRISEISYFIPSVILVALFPAIIQAKKTSSELYFKRMKKLLLLLITIAISASIFTTLISKELILLLYGKSFIEAVPVLQIYAWSNIGATLNVFTQQMLIAEHKTKSISYVTFFGMATNVILNMILIPKYGISGAALATLISYIVPFLSLITLRTTRNLVINILKA